MVLTELGRYEEAETHLRRAITINPQTENTHHRLVHVLYEQGRYEEALEAARIAVEQAPDLSEAHANLGVILKALGRYAEAETHLRRAIALNPQAGDAYLNLGATLYEQERYEEALEATRSAVAQATVFSLAHINLAEILSKLGRYDEAMDALAQATTLAPPPSQAAELHFLMGQMARENGQYETAAEHYRRTLEAAPHHAEALHWLATLRGQQQRYDEMLKLLQRFVALHPNDAATYSNMGIALVFLGRNDEALQCFDQALSLDPTLENVHTNREALLETMQENVE